jgi:hypothetical protein
LRNPAHNRHSKENAMPKSTQQRKSRLKAFDYEVVVTAPRMRPTALEVKAPNSAIARREAKKAFREEKPTKVAEARFSAHRKEH